MLDLNQTTQEHPEHPDLLSFAS